MRNDLAAVGGVFCCFDVAPVLPFLNNKMGLVNKEIERILAWYPELENVDFRWMMNNEYQDAYVVKNYTSIKDS